MTITVDNIVGNQGFVTPRLFLKGDPAKLKLRANWRRPKVRFAQLWRSASWTQPVVPSRITRLLHGDTTRPDCQKGSKQAHDLDRAGR